MKSLLLCAHRDKNDLYLESISVSICPPMPNVMYMPWLTSKTSLCCKKRHVNHLFYY